MWFSVPIVCWPRGDRRLFVFASLAVSSFVFGMLRAWPGPYLVALALVGFPLLLATRPRVRVRLLLNQLRVELAEEEALHRTKQLLPHRVIPDTPNSPSTAPEKSTEQFGDGSPPP